MNKLALVPLVCAVIMVTACSRDKTQPVPQPTAVPKADSTVIAASPACGKPPDTLTLSGKTYHLQSESAADEAGMKFAYVKCEQGKYTLGDADDAYVIYSVGNPNKNSGLLFVGNWNGTGTWSRVLYAP